MKSDEEITMELESTSLENRAKTLVVINEVGYVEAMEGAAAAKAYERKVKAFFEPMRTAAHEAHLAICDREKAVVKNAQHAYEYFSSGAKQWREKQEAVRKAAENEARQKQIKAAEEEKMGKPDLADRVMAAPVSVTGTAPQAPAAPKIAGHSIRREWRGRVVDLAALPKEFMALDEKKINAVVKALGELHGIPGVEAYQVEIESWRK